MNTRSNIAFWTATLAAVLATPLLAGAQTNAGAVPRSSINQFEGGPPPHAGDLWVSPAGNDANSGTRQEPLLTLPAAIDKVMPGQTIWMTEGVYKFTETVILSRHNTLELLVLHDCGDTELQINSTSSLLPAHNRVLNCDSYLNADNSAEDADGFAAKLMIGPGNSFEGCRAWYNCDDNWDLYDAQAVVTFKDCGSIAAKHPTRSRRNSDGNGFKLGGIRIVGQQLDFPSITPEMAIAAKRDSNGNLPDIRTLISESPSTPLFGHAMKPVYLQGME